MLFCNHGRFCQQVRFLQRQFLQDGDSPFATVLSENVVMQAMQAIELVWKDRIYTPLVTLWVFLSQVLSQDHSCRALDRSSRFAGAMRVFGGNRRLLISESNR